MQPQSSTDPGLQDPAARRILPAMATADDDQATLKALQERLGALHDADVLMPFVADNVDHPTVRAGVVALADCVHFHP